MRWSSILAFAILSYGIFQASPAAADRARFVDGQTWGLEVGLGGGWPVRDTAYARTLETFGFERPMAWKFRFSAAVEAIVLPYFSVLLQTNLIDKREWDRDSGIGPEDHFNLNSWTLDVHARAFYPVASWFRVYVQLGVGPTFTGTRLYVRSTSPSGQDRYREIEVGYNVAGLAGFEVSSPHVGFFTQGGYFYAPSPVNRLGDRHQSGGGLILLGLSFHFGRPR